MKYIRDIDEQIVAPPYQLGTDDIKYQFEVHHFLLDSKPEVLQKLVDAHLNCVFDLENENGEPQRARKRTIAGTNDELVRVKYQVPEGTKTRLSFVRYGRVFVLDDGQPGALEYTEVILSCQVTRWVDGELDSQPDETLDFVGLIYIDDRAFKGDERDPYALPIIFGRELFGMPKAPGRIRYEPDSSDCKFPCLEIWRPKSEEDGSLIPVKAIEFGDPQGKVTQESSAPRVRPPPTQPMRQDDKTKLILERKLVALKQFADPIGAAGGEELLACYQAIVETPLEYHPNKKPTTIWGSLPDTVIHFPELPASKTRVPATQALASSESPASKAPDVQPLDIIAKFGLETIPEDSRRVRVSSTNIYYAEGQMVFASPKRTAVWHLFP